MKIVVTDSSTWLRPAYFGTKWNQQSFLVITNSPFPFDGRMQWISVDENALWMEAPLLGQSPFLDSLETKFVILRWVRSLQSEMEIWNCALIISQQHSHHNTAWQAPLHFTSLTDDAAFSCRHTSGTVSKKNEYATTDPRSSKPMNIGSYAPTFSTSS